MALRQKPIEGVSMVYTFNDAQAKSRHTVQYAEFIGNRGIYKDGWYATTLHKLPWEPQPRASFEQDKWELSQHCGRLQLRDRPRRQKP